MKKIFFPLFLLFVFVGCRPHSIADQMIQQVKLDYPQAHKYFVYGSVIRTVINYAAEDKSSVESLKQLKKVTYFSIPTNHSKDTFQALKKQALDNDLIEFIAIEKGSVKSIPDDFKAFTKDAKEISVLIKDESGITSNLVVVMRNKESVIFLVTDGNIKIKDLMNIKLNPSNDLEKTFKSLPNIF